jgi:hypothetical protein
MSATVDRLPLHRSDGDQDQLKGMESRASLEASTFSP